MMTHPAVLEAREHAERLREATADPTWGSTHAYSAAVLERLCVLTDELFACIEELAEDYNDDWFEPDRPVLDTLPL